MKTLIADRGTGEPISLGAALIAGKKVRPDALAMLEEDHRVVLGWFAWYRQAQTGALRMQIAGKICAALRAHMAAEEEILYPEAERAIDDENLVDRALEEHAAAKELMERIESTSVTDAEQSELVARLSREIEAHVKEEETELMPRIRASGLDVYAIGAAVAARRVDEFFATGTSVSGDARLTEYPKMHISQDEAQKFYILGLKNQHAMAAEGKSLVKTQLDRVENYPALLPRLEAHLEEKEAQLERIERILDRHGESPSKIKDLTLKAGAVVSGIGHASADDEVVKNSFATLAMAKFEAAAYETLILFAEAADDTAALPALQQSLSEERRMAAFIEGNLRPTAMRFLQLRSEGAQASH